MTWLAVVVIIVLLLVLCNHEFQLSVQHWFENRKAEKERAERMRKFRGEE